MNGDYLGWVSQHWVWIITAVASIASVIALGMLFSLNRIVEKPVDADDVIDIRLQEVRAKERKYSKVKVRYGRAAFLLSFTQYVIGAAIAAPFTESALKNKSGLLGSFGLLVLLATVIQQRYRPYSRSLRAEQQLVLLKFLVRYAEDASVNGADRKEILRTLTKGINRIELLEATDPDLSVGEHSDSFHMLQANPVKPAEQIQPAS